MTIISGCHFDPFGLNSKTIVGSYSLEKWEDGVTYYLNGPGNNEGWGVLEGTVKEIGWDEQYILVFQNDNCCGSGWRIVNSKTKTISPLIKANDVKRHSEINGLATFSASVAWSQL